MTPGPRQKNKAEQYADYLIALSKRPICTFCHAFATVKLGELFCCDEHGKKYSGYNTEYARSLREGAGVSQQELPQAPQQ